MQAMTQALAIEIMLAGHSVMLTGPAGSGKTYALNQFIQQAKKNKKVVAVTATTGLAASHLGGATIHAWSGISIHDQLPKNFFASLSKTKQEGMQKADTLIIDEISMLHDFRLDMVEEVTRTVRGNDKPFGGLQVILCGDFFQLPPVTRGQQEQGKFVVNSAAWQALDPVICYLVEQHRQNDEALLEILNAMRQGDIRRRHAEQLLARINQPLLGRTEAAELHTTNIDVDSINNSRLASIPDNTYAYTMQTTGSANYVETLQRACLAPVQLELKKGAFVMFVKNSLERKYVNGTLGTVVDFEPETNWPVVETRAGKRIAVTPETWELRENNKKRASLTQLPLRLAWAITIHKSQGMTLDAARMDLSRAFVEGMGYVALSRVRSLDSLSLKGINRMALRVSPDALSIDGVLRQKSQVDAERFAHLARKLEERAARLEAARLKKERDAAAWAAQQAEQDGATGSAADSAGESDGGLADGATPKSKKSAKPKNEAWAAKLAAMREVYPKAFMPWPAQEDDQLLDLFNAGKGIKEMSSALGRHPGSIRARVKKHLGEDAVIPA